MDHVVFLGCFVSSQGYKPNFAKSFEIECDASNAGDKGCFDARGTSYCLF